ncbi:MAG: zinc-binding alcohol dehydrogenase [Candidatus Bathyarchaeia archaeon]
MQGRQIVFVGEMRVEVQPLQLDEAGLKETEIIGQTIFTLISPGTELASLTGLADALWARKPSFPRGSGYASVDRVIAAGSRTGQFRVGDVVLNQGNHASLHRLDTSKTPVVKLPCNAALEEAPFARMCGVGMTTLRTTRTRPGDVVAVFGLGLVGNLAAQVFQSSGYEVVGIEPDLGRRALAERCSIRHVIDPTENLAEQVRSATGEDSCHLVLECSGSAKAMVEAMKIAKVGAEIVQVATPWRDYPDVSASELLRPIFLKYLQLRGGWEWEIPVFPVNFARGSILQNYRHALGLIARREVKVRELITHLLKPEQAQEAYEGLLNNRSEYMGVLFDWQRL